MLRSWMQLNPGCLDRYPKYEFPYKAAQLPYYNRLARYLGYMDKEWIKSLQKKNRFVHYWTVDNPDDIKDIISLGADGIITNDPEKVHGILKSMGIR